MITVFYDGDCPLCSREIKYYAKISPPGVFDWKNISSSSSELNNLNITRTQALKFLHAVDSKGKVYVGIDSFILIWQQLKPWRLLARTISLPVVHSIFKLLYILFAIIRFRIKYPSR